MTGVIGVELRRDTARAVLVGGLRRAARHPFETAWDPARPADLVAQLRARFGSVRRIGICVGLAFLHPKHVHLPPAPPAARRRILSLEPDRFFPVSAEPAAVALVHESDFAFATPAEWVERWVSAFEAWAPVECIEPAPVSLARGLGRQTTGAWVMEAGPGERGWARIENGRVRAARRVPLDAALSDAGLEIPGDFIAAVGAARGVDATVDSMLVCDSLAAGIRGRRLQRLAGTALLCAVSLGLAAWAVDRSRDRQLERIRSEIAALSPQAEAGLEWQERLAALDREAEVLRDLRSRPDPLRVLAALSAALPRDATVLGIKAVGEDWQIDGTASDAAAIVRLLEGDERQRVEGISLPFEGVRFLSATSRFRDGNRDLETFSIAFRVRPGP